MKSQHETTGTQEKEGFTGGSMKQMKLFNINGIELHDIDSLDSIHDDDYMYYSFSMPIFYSY